MQNALNSAGTRAMELLAGIVTSRARAEIFTLLFGLSDSELHVRELVKRADLNIITVRRDLKKLLELDLVKARRDGNRLYYRANVEHPLYFDIRNLVLKTSGLVEILGEALGQAGIRAAFVFGSVASGDVRARSDVDLMIVGDLGLRDVCARLARIREKIGRDVNPHVFTATEFVKRREGGDHFLAGVLSAPKLFVVGNENELGRMGQ